MCSHPLCRFVASHRREDGDSCFEIVPESLGNRRFGEVDGFFDPFIAPIAPRDVVLGHARKRKRQLEFDDGAHGRLFAVTFLADEIAFE